MNVGIVGILLVLHVGEAVNNALAISVTCAVIAPFLVHSLVMVFCVQIVPVMRSDGKVKSDDYCTE